MATNQSEGKTSFLRRWIRPRLLRLTICDWTFWISLTIGTLVALFPILSPLVVKCGLSIESLASMIISFASIGLGVALALAALVVTLPSGRFRKVMQRPDPQGGATAYAELAFVAFWAGFANLLAATVSLVASVVAGPYRIMANASVLPAVTSGVMAFATVYALLQMLAALIALLEAAGLSEKFQD